MQKTDDNECTKGAFSASNVIKRMSAATLCLAAFSLLLGLSVALSPLATYSASDSISSEVNATVDGFIQITGVENQALDLELSASNIATGNYITGSHTVTIYTNIPGGYTLSLQSDHSNLRREGLTTGLYDGTGDSTGGFHPIGGTITTQANPYLSYNHATLSGVTFASRIVDNTIPELGAWGFNLDANTSFTSVPTSATIITATNDSNQLTPATITFGLQSGSNTPAGTYGAYITYTATANGEPRPSPPNISHNISSAFGTTSGPVTVITDIDSVCKWNLNQDFDFSTEGILFSTTNEINHSTTVTGLSAGTNTIYVRCANINDLNKISESGSVSVSISNVSPLVTGEAIQLIGTGARTCPTVRTRAVDARDDNTYWVRLIPNTRQGGGDLCWMETNLAYKGGGNNTYGDTMTIVAGTSAPGVRITNVTGDGQVCRGDNASLSTHQQGCYWEPTGSNITSGNTNPSTSTNGMGQYGLLYNLCAAMGNQPASCQTGAATQPKQSPNPGNGTVYNVCPAGWRLPTGQVTTGEYTLLNNVINSGSTTSDSGLRTNSLFMYNGAFGSGSFSSIGSWGGYLSSTVGTTTGVNIINFSSTIVVNPAPNNAKGNGRSVRCVAP